MDEVISSTNSRWCIENCSISSAIWSYLEPQWVILVVKRIKLSNWLRELEVTEVLPNTSTSRIWRNVTLNTS